MTCHPVKFKGILGDCYAIFSVGNRKDEEMFISYWRYIGSLFLSFFESKHTVRYLCKRVIHTGSAQVENCVDRQSIKYALTQNTGSRSGIFDGFKVLIGLFALTTSIGFSSSAFALKGADFAESTSALCSTYSGCAAKMRTAKQPLAELIQKIDSNQSSHGLLDRVGRSSLTPEEGAGFSADPSYSHASDIVGLIRSYAPNGEIQNIDLSADGKAVVFESSASNLVRGDTNRTVDVFLLIAEHRLLRRISVNSLGDQVIGNSVNPRISPDGGWVVYESSAPGLDQRDDNRFRDIYLYEVNTGQTKLISVSLDDRAGNRDSRKPVVSRNARVISFESEATNLIENDENKSSDIFAYNSSSETISAVSRSILPTEADVDKGNVASYNPDVSDDGAFIAFESFSSDLTLDDYNSNSDVFLHNLADQTTTLISKAGSKGAVIFGDSTSPSLSGDGNAVVFQSHAQFSETDLNEAQDSYVYNVEKSELTRLPAEEMFAGSSVSFAGSANPVIASDGSVVVYEMSLTNHSPTENQQDFGSHLALYKIGDSNSRRIDLFESSDEAVNNILGYTVSLSFNAEVLAFDVSRVGDSERGQKAAKSGWLSKKRSFK